MYTFASGEGGDPVGVVLEKETVELAFPAMFCGERRTSNEERRVNISCGEIIKAELDRICSID